MLILFECRELVSFVNSTLLYEGLSLSWIMVIDTVQLIHTFVNLGYCGMFLIRGCSLCVNHLPWWHILLFSVLACVCQSFIKLCIYLIVMNDHILLYYLFAKLNCLFSILLLQLDVGRSHPFFCSTLEYYNISPYWFTYESPPCKVDICTVVRSKIIHVNANDLQLMTCYITIACH